MQELTLAHANDFFENHLDGFLKKLTPDLRPLWGKMTSQHVVEHLAWVVGGSAGKWTSPVFTPAEKLPKYRLFVYTNIAIKPGFNTPLLDPGELPALALPSLDDAVEDFWQAWADFEGFFLQNPKLTPNHPVFGPLSGDEWRRFHFKHAVHHLAQFGLTTVGAHGLVMPGQ